jgi:hypothetical protein
MSESVLRRRVEEHRGGTGLALLNVGQGEHSDEHGHAGPFDDFLHLRHQLTQSPLLPSRHCDLRCEEVHRVRLTGSDADIPRLGGEPFSHRWVTLQQRERCEAELAMPQQGRLTDQFDGGRHQVE